MLARTRRNTRWPRRRSSLATPVAGEEFDDVSVAIGLTAARDFGPLAGEFAGLVECFDGIGVTVAVGFAAGTLKDSIFKARHPRNRSQLRLVPLPRPSRQIALDPSRQPVRQLS
jgi:hypothetical protein